MFVFGFDQYENPKQLSKSLADAISEELSKPEDDIDMDFIDECQSLINVLANALNTQIENKYQS